MRAVLLAALLTLVAAANASAAVLVVGDSLVVGTGPYLRENLGILEGRPPEVAPAVRKKLTTPRCDADESGNPSAS